MIDGWTMLQTAAGLLFGLIFVAGTLAISVLWEQRPGRLRFLPFFNTGDLGSFHDARSYCGDSSFWSGGSGGCGGGSSGDCGGGGGDG